jgi:N6-L-threonylcarbamoyladenine synthase
MTYILGIETSCDETAAAVIEADEKQVSVLSHVVNSQIKIHEQFGGVVPEVAARQHIINILPIVDQALKQANLTIKQITAIAATYGPGLAGSLMVGFETAKTLAWLNHKSLYETNHLIGHLWSWLLPEVGKTESIKITFPFIALVVSGGHTELVLVKDFINYEVVGKTLDDAAGEAFDKAAKIMNLGYPGGPILGQRATQGDKNTWSFPRPLLQQKDFNFSFSGLKTSLLYKIKELENLNDEQINNLCASWQAAVVEVLAEKTIKAARFYQAKAVAVVGGVSANKSLREAMTEKCAVNNWPLLLPKMLYTGDNATMIALAGFISHHLGKQKVNKNFIISAIKPNLNI